MKAFMSSQASRNRVAQNFGATMYQSAIAEARRVLEQVEPIRIFTSHEGYPTGYHKLIMAQALTNFLDSGKEDTLTLD